MALSRTTKWKIYYPLGGALISGIPMSFLWAHLIKKEGRTPTWTDRLAGFAIGAVPGSLIGFMVAQGKKGGLLTRSQSKALQEAARRHSDALETCKNPTKRQRAWCKRKGYI